MEICDFDTQFFFVNCQLPTDDKILWKKIVVFHGIKFKKNLKNSILYKVEKNLIPCSTNFFPTNFSRKILCVNANNHLESKRMKVNK